MSDYYQSIQKGCLIIKGIVLCDFIFFIIKTVCLVVVVVTITIIGWHCCMADVGER